MARLALHEVHWPDGDVGLIARGVVDEYTVDLFRRRLVLAVSTAPRNVIIDVAQCELAAVGLAALRHLETRDSDRGSRAVLVASASNALRTFHIVGLASRYRIYPTLEGARNACHTPAALGAMAAATPTDMVEQTEARRGAKKAATQVAVAPSTGPPTRHSSARRRARGAESRRRSSKHG